MTAQPQPPEPFTEDIDTGGFWAAAAEGRLVVRACTSCGTVLHLPKAYCHACGSWETTWRGIAPTGTLHTWTVTRQRLHPAFPAPYTVVLIDLDEAPGARLVGYLPGAPELQIGMPFHAIFEPLPSGKRIIQWHPAGATRPLRREGEDDE